MDWGPVVWCPKGKSNAQSPRPITSSEQPAVYKACIAVIVIGTIAAVAAPAYSQTLTERIASIKKQRAAEQAAVQTKEELGPKAKLLQSLLYHKLTVNFDQTPARDVFDYLSTTLGVNLIARYSDDTIAHGIDPETPISLSVEDMHALAVLELALEQCATVEGCTWQLRNDFIEVGTKERLSTPTAREIRTYPIDELVFAPTRFNNAPTVGINHLYPGYGGYGGYAHPYSGRLSGGYGGYGGGYGGSVGPTTLAPAADQRKAQRTQEIVNLITETIEPMAWTVNGGDWATIRYRDGSLIINAPDYIHRQIDGYPHVPPPNTESHENPPANTGNTNSTSPPPTAGQPKPTRP